jgi:hypothetical protein
VLNEKKSGRERRSKSASERSGIQARPVDTNLDGVTGMVAIVKKEEEEEEVEEEAVEATDLPDILQSPSVYTDEEVGHLGVLWRHAFDSPPTSSTKKLPATNLVQMYSCNTEVVEEEGCKTTIRWTLQRC